MTTPSCTCSDPSVACPEGMPEESAADPRLCAFCAHLDPYDPCPVRGFGCGSTADSACDCCTPEQRTAAAGVLA